MLKETLEALNIAADGFYADGTFGRGGHSRAILARLGATGHLLVMDKDPEAIASAHAQFEQDARVVVRHGSFRYLDRELSALGWQGKMDGILLDLGVSSPQLDDAQRGFSFREDGPLDMRMDSSSGRSAAEWLAGALVLRSPRHNEPREKRGPRRAARRSAGANIRGETIVTRVKGACPSRVRFPESRRT